MSNVLPKLSNESCRKARLSRDPRFDGKFFIGVLTTGIFCRPICPAIAPKEENVRYFDSAVSASSAGLRPCLRCRPDSAPNSSAWKGTRTTLERALTLIEGGVLSGNDGIDIEALSDRLGISSRYLRQLFSDNFGTSPKKYAQFRDLMFAKQLLHQTNLTVTQIAFAAGFNSVRRFNESFKQTLKLTPTALRKTTQKSAKSGKGTDKMAQITDGVMLTLFFAYRPPLNWTRQMAFYRLRMVDKMEWELDGEGYGRCFQFGEARGYFEASHQAEKNRFKVNIYLASSDHLASLKDITMQIRRLLDLDADMDKIETVLASTAIMTKDMIKGLRLPGTWSVFEAGCRAVLGQQVSIIQATALLNTLVKAYGDNVTISAKQVVLFPTPEAIAAASLDELKMPGARKAALNALGLFVSENPDGAVDEWLSIKGIGPWTLAYAKMRGLSDPDILLCSDLVVKKKVLSLYQQGVEPDIHNKQANTLSRVDYSELTDRLTEQASPWGSYLTFQLWNLA
ncbi:helix-turn-helix domain-containing protein [Shewanella benthica]|uniref:DNA-3-methyladenine glycosylase 2 family protein n=1 Tax=Shewanella benthica TaxID=43661 RepID=UPI00187AC037|nr:AlkA N-terminal domain-containing protein [Shewanella benthica]MBE7216318.1 DNA-3-methyladenine glycosylase 2 family protein [Shewanella benthica]MCL1065129.1 helix-turn-helix domain-containing protein [Shewanella benthica]